MAPPAEGGNGASTVQDLEAWKANPSADLPLEKVELLSALVFGELTIRSSEGSTIVLRTDFEVDSAGLVETTAQVDMERGQLSGDVAHPDGPVQANFFQTDKARVGEPFTIMTYDRQRGQQIIAVFGTVARLSIFPRTSSGPAKSSL